MFKHFKKIIFLSFILLILMPYSLFAEDKPKVALVLSGGGAKGFAHIGMLKVIDELGIQVDAIYGTSMGAIIGGMYASGMTALEIEERITKLNWVDLLNDRVTRSDLYVARKRWLPTGNYFFQLNNKYMPILPQGIILGNDIHLQIFYELWQTSHINDFQKLPIPFKCVVTDIESGSLVLFEIGSLADALRASSSIPSVFVPIELNGRLYVDGGVTQNFAADIAKYEGNDIIIGLITSTEMFDREDLNSPIRIMNQTLNIGAQQRQHYASTYADHIIAPNTEKFSIMDFHRADEIINVGYYEALKHKQDLSNLMASFITDEPKICLVERLPDKIKFDTIEVNNTKYLTPHAVRDYVALKTNEYYSRDDVLHAFKRAYSTELFDNIFPNIIKVEDSYHLVINVKEKERRTVALNMVYNQQDSLVAGIILDMRNVLLRDSNLIINLQLGGRSAFDIDYTKTFSRNSSLYYRLSPYTKKSSLYIYDDDFFRVRSYNNTEIGFTAGIGSYALKNTIIEPFLYSYRMEFTRAIAPIDLFDEVFYSSGLGLKAHYENIDDFPFYTRGARLFAKYNISGTSEISEAGYQKLVANLDTAIPLNSSLSLLLGGEYGTYFSSTPPLQDPFYIGGMDNFIGLYQRQISAPYYRKYDLGLRINPINNLYLDIQSNFVTYGNYDMFPLLSQYLLGVGAIVGYNTPLGPARIGFGVNQNSKVFGYISIGYDYDALFFSRR